MNQGHQKITNKVLLVEGNDDLHAVKALCKFHHVPENFGVVDCNGKSGVLKQLNALIVSADLPQVIGVMLDADQSSSARWQSIQNKLQNNNHQYPLPVVPYEDGTIIDSIEDKPKLGFWLMPNNKDAGILEDFCTELAEPKSLDFARKCVKEASQMQVTTFKKIDHSKAVIHTYLAWQDEPGYPFGKAITAHSLKPNTEIALKFTNWLTQLFR